MVMTVVVEFIRYKHTDFLLYSTSMSAYDMKYDELSIGRQLRQGPYHFVRLNKQTCYLLNNITIGLNKTSIN